MHLPQDDIDLFYKLFIAVLGFVRQRNPELLQELNSSELQQTLLARLKPLRDYLYVHPELLEEFAAANTEHFTEEELAIVRGWRHFVSGQFILLRQLKAHAIFLDTHKPPKAYGVLALVSPFEEFADLPLMLETTLLPFKGQIIYDGILVFSQVWFGRSIREDFNDAYRRAKATFGLITSLPYMPEEEENSDEQLLRSYLKSERIRDEHWDEIWNLLGRDPDLLPVFHQETGKLAARGFKRQLKEHGIAPAWFALLDNAPIASGKTREEVMATVRWLVPADKQEYVYCFQWKP